MTRGTLMTMETAKFHTVIEVFLFSCLPFCCSSTRGATMILASLDFASAACELEHVHVQRQAVRKTLCRNAQPGSVKNHTRADCTSRLTLQPHRRKLKVISIPTAVRHHLEIEYQPTWSLLLHFCTSMRPGWGLHGEGRVGQQRPNQAGTVELLDFWLRS